MPTPRVNTPLAIKRRKPIEKICEKCGQTWLCPKKRKNARLCDKCVSEWYHRND